MNTLITIALYLAAVAFVIRWHYVATGAGWRNNVRRRPYNRRRDDKVA